VAPRPVAERRLGDVADRDRDLAASLEVADRAARHHVGDGTANLRLVAAHEPLAVHRAAGAVVRTAIDYHGHRRSTPLLPIATCAPAGTTRTAAAPASRCSPSRPCARRSSRACGGLRPTPSR